MMDVIDDTSEEVMSGLKLVADEIMAGFDRARSRLRPKAQRARRNATVRTKRGLASPNACFPREI